MMPTFPKVGLDALLTPENCAVLLIDHQSSQLANVNSHEPTLRHWRALWTEGARPQKRSKQPQVGERRKSHRELALRCS